MKSYLISDNVDTQMGMRLAGIDGVVVHEYDEVVCAIDTAMQDSNIAVILMTKKLIDLCHEKVYGIKFSCKRPLIVEIPDRHATSKLSETISGYVSEAIGLKL